MRSAKGTRAEREAADRSSGLLLAAGRGGGGDTAQSRRDDAVAVNMRSGEVEDGLMDRVVMWGVRGARSDAPHEERAGVGFEGSLVDGRADDGGTGSTIARTATPAV